MRRDSDDLLQPSLDSGDDLHGVRRPWNPDTLLWLTLLLGFFGSGLLYALNWRRLGVERRTLPTLLAFVGLGVAFFVGVALWRRDGGKRPDPRPAAETRWSTAVGIRNGPGAVSASSGESSGVVRFTGNLVALGVAALVAKGQRRRYRAHAYHGGVDGKLALPALLAFLLNMGVLFALFFAVALVVPGRYR